MSSAAAGPPADAGCSGVAAGADPAVGHLMLVDGHSLFHRAFFALPALTSPSGQPTGAVYGFLAMLARLLEDERPTHLAVAMDRPEPTFRHRAFADYKGHRPEMPSELASQIPMFVEALKVLGMPTVDHAGAEADDVIGTLSAQGAAAGMRVSVVTGDRDALQLVGGPVTVLLTRRGISDMDRMDDEAVRAKYGVGAERLVAVKALMGDTSDNIPGVPTIGEKTACKLIATYGDVEHLLEDLDHVGPPRVQAALRSHVDLVRRNIPLCTIVRDLPMPWDAEALRRRTPDAEGARALFDRMGSHNLIGRFHVDGSTAAEEEPAVYGAGSSDAVPSSALGEPPAEPPEVPRVPVSAAEMAAALSAHVGAVAVAAEVHHGTVAALAAVRTGSDEPALSWEARSAERPALPELGELLAYDSKTLCHVTLDAGERWRAPAFDVQIAAYLLEPERSSYPLADVCRQFGLQPPAPGDLSGAAAAIARLREPMALALDQHGLRHVYEDVELPLVSVLAEMERTGVLVDRGALVRLESEFDRRLRETEADIHAEAGTEFNINSTHQLAEVLFGRLGLHPPKRTKTGFSTDADVLEQLAAEHPLPAKVLTFRTLQKLQSTYVQALSGLIAADGRIHTTFQQHVAVTGRLASHNPNLQNIPVREEIGRPIRRVFVAPQGSVLVAADYSQIELRVLAHFSRDPGLVEAFLDDGDIHRRTAAEVWGVPPEAVTESQRGAAKAVNFGIVYGISDFGLARQLGCDRSEAHGIIERYFVRYPGVKAYMDGAVAEARQRGVVRTLSGRLRRLPDILASNRNRRAFAERTAMNTPIQGTAADLIKIAMIAVHAELRRRPLRARLLLQVHDELIFEAPADEARAVADLARRCMESAGELAVPLRADVHAGPNWMDMAEI